MLSGVAALLIVMNILFGAWWLLAANLFSLGVLVLLGNYADDHVHRQRQPDP